MDGPSWGQFTNEITPKKTPLPLLQYDTFKWYDKNSTQESNPYRALSRIVSAPHSNGLDHFAAEPPMEGDGTMMEIDAFRDNWDFLSNFYACQIAFEGIVYHSAEAAFQAAKCKNTADRMLFADCHPTKAKKLGKMVALREDWEQIKVEVMRKVLVSKFQQNPWLLGRLLATWPARLIEGNSWHDNFWGACTCAACRQKTQLNMLGKLLEEIREEGMRA